MLRKAMIAAATLIVACGGTNYVYAPEGAKVAADGRLISRVGVPPERPRGEVRITAMGITRLRGQADRDIDALHLRVVVNNDSDDTPWTVDTRQQLIEIRGAGRAAPLFANTDRDTLPILTIPRRDQRTLDLFYPLPAGIDDADDLAGFDLLWQVETGARVVAQRTPFGRMEIEPLPTTGPYYAGWGPYWWHDPFYSHHVWLHHRPIVIRENRPVVVRRHPARGRR